MLIISCFCIFISKYKISLIVICIFSQLNLSLNDKISLNDEIKIITTTTTNSGCIAYYSPDDYVILFVNVQDDNDNIVYGLANYEATVYFDTSTNDLRFYRGSSCPVNKILIVGLLKK